MATVGAEWSDRSAKALTRINESSTTESPANVANEKGSKVDISKLTENQKKFIRSAERAGYKIAEYSGRGMFQRSGPSVYLTQGDCWRPRGVKVGVDSMGMGSVVYAPN